MRILLVPDVPNWAIGALAKTKMKYASHHNFKMHCLHPRDAGLKDKQLEFEQVVRSFNPDIIHFEYFRTASQVLEAMPFLRDFKIILSHHNQRDKALFHADWNKLGVNMLVTATNKAAMDLIQRGQENVQVVKYGCELDEFTYNETEPELFTVGYAGRVVPWKNLKEMCEVSKELGYRVIGCGYVDKPDYWDTVPKDNLDFHGGMGRGAMMPANFQAELYRKMTCYVMYSTEEKESGTLGLLEAMARGVPVMATEQGMARDIIKDGENGIIFTPENFQARLKMVMEDKELREKLRKNAWKTIMKYSEKKMARDYAKAYYKVLFGDKKVVSVVVPIFNRADKLVEVLSSIENQGYEAKEIIVADDGSTDNTRLVVEEAKKQFRTPVLYLKTGDKLDYGLAKARNMGAIEALGDTLLFLDDRYALEENALENIIKGLDSKTFGFGLKIIKGKESTKTAFIENFAWINRKEFMNAGMFCERLTMYGGLSQETRTRFERQGYKMTQNKDVKCREIVKSSGGKNKKKEIWRAKHLLQKMYE